MLVLSRTPGESIEIEDVVLTLIRVTEEYAEISLEKRSGGKTKVITLTKQNPVEICYNTHMYFIEARGNRARLAFDHPPEVSINRSEFTT